MLRANLPITFYLLICTLLWLGCGNDHSQQVSMDYSAEKALEQCISTMRSCLTNLPIDSLKIPRSVEDDGSIIVSPSRQWTSGFFPGILWMLYDFSQDEEIGTQAQKWTSFVEKEKFDTHTHDLGFKINNSFGKAYQVTGNSAYRDVVVQASKTLIKRFNSNVGAIRSWDWGRDQWQFPVIIDNMMNLEMLFDATKFTGDSIYYQVAYQHALTTLANHFRDDQSSYHVIDYDTISGQVLNRHTHQGYSHESAWSRGQAWGLYGFTKAYEYTGDEKFLTQAKKIEKYIFENKTLPDDLVPYWDYDAPSIPNEPRDVSAAAVTASALFDLAKVDSESAERYISNSKKILANLSKDYKTTICPFILDHSVGSVPGEFEVDKPIIYADYYYVEALLKDIQYSNSEK